MSTVPEWQLVGDWFDICSCNIPCPWEFAQAPTNNACQGMLAWHIREGHYGTVRLGGLNLLALGTFTKLRHVTVRHAEEEEYHENQLQNCSRDAFRYHAWRLSGTGPLRPEQAARLYGRNQRNH